MATADDDPGFRLYSYMMDGRWHFVHENGEPELVAPYVNLSNYR